MAREKLFAKFKGRMNADGTPAEFVNGVPATDFSESEFAALTDEQKAAVQASPLYALRHDAPAEAEKAAKRVEKSDVPPMTGSVIVPTPAPAVEEAAPKAEAKK